MNKELLYIANYRMPTERTHGLQVAKMCEAFAAEGIDVTLIVPQRGKVTQDVFDYYKLRQRFKIVYLPVWDLTGKIPGLGFFIQSATFAWAVKNYLKKTRYSGLIFARDQFSLFILSLFHYKHIVYEIHTMPKHVSYVHRKAYKAADQIIAISQGLANALVLVGIPRDRIIVVRDGVDLNIFQKNSPEISREKLSLPTDKKIILYAGSFLRWKGVYTLAEAAAELPDDYVVVLIGGTRFDFQDLKRYVDKIGSRRLILLQQVQQDIFKKYISVSDVFVIPNSSMTDISRLYTSPLKFFEYLSSNKPIIATDLPSLHEIGDQFDGVFYCRADDPSALAEAIRSADSEKKYERDLSSFSWKARVQKIVSSIR